MLLISALALGLIETTNSNLGTTSYLGGFGYAAVAAAAAASSASAAAVAAASAAGATSSVESVIAGEKASINSETVIDRGGDGIGGIGGLGGVAGGSSFVDGVGSGGIESAAMPSTSAGSVHSNSLPGNGHGPGSSGGGSGVNVKDIGSIASNTAIVGSSASNGGTITWDNNGTLRSASPGDWSIGQCLIWQRPHHLYFQLGNAFFFLAFLGPRNPFGALWLRAFLVIGCILMGMYGYMIECTPDVVLWSGLFLAVNSIYLIVVLCRLRPVRFEKEIEAVYASLFKPLRVSRQQFKKVLNCMRSIRALKYQEVYAQEKVTKVDSLSLVLSGKLVVSQNQRALHIVFPHQFLDSPEWFGVSTDDYFQVSIMAMEESRVLIWHRDKLKLSIMAEPFLQTVFDHILGRDVVKKLMQVTQVSESIASNGFLPSGGFDDGEDKPMLIMKKSIEGHGLTALINRQLQEEHVPLLGRAYPTKENYLITPNLNASNGSTSNDVYAGTLPRISKYYDCAGDPNSWRLGRIDETDHETAV